MLPHTVRIIGMSSNYILIEKLFILENCINFCFTPSSNVEVDNVAFNKTKDKEMKLHSIQLFNKE